MTERADLVIMAMTPDDHATADELRQMLQFFDGDTELVHLELDLDSGFVGAAAEGFITAQKYQLLECRIELESLVEELFDSSNAEDCISGETTANSVYIRYVLLRQSKDSYLRKVEGRGNLMCSIAHAVDVAQQKHDWDPSSSHTPYAVKVIFLSHAGNVTTKQLILNRSIKDKKLELIEHWKKHWAEYGAYSLNSVLSVAGRICPGGVVC